MGGTDEDVKQYFFSLSTQELKTVLAEYGKQWGPKAEQYASDTMDRWKNGTTRMSGQNAKRLFDLLPPRMPLDKKFHLVEKLWKKLGPHSHKLLQVGAQTNPDKVLKVLQEHITQTVDQFTLPPALENRFKWLAANDVRVQQQLLNHFQELEKTQTVRLFKNELQVILKHRSVSSEAIQALRKIIEINNHKFELEFLPSGDNIILSEPKRTVSSGADSSQFPMWIFWVIGAIVLLIVLNQ